MDPTAELAIVRRAYAKQVLAEGGVTDPRIRAAFARVPREDFLGRGPWQVMRAPGVYTTTPEADPVYVYTNQLVGLLPGRGINNGQPSLHAQCLAALQPQIGETVVHVGAGGGYYTAILARLVGADRAGGGHVEAYEVEPELARLASANLAEFPGVNVEARSGAVGPLSLCDIVYVNCGATAPLPLWLDALRPGGRLLLPLTAEGGVGVMLLAKRPNGYGDAIAWPARVVVPVLFIGCEGARGREEERALGAALARGGGSAVRWLWRAAPPDGSAWCAGRGWWLTG